MPQADRTTNAAYLRDGEPSALIRVLTLDETRTAYAMCHWWTRAEEGCDATPCFRLATPVGHLDYCRDHIDHAIASLPPEWIEGWAYREPVGKETDDVPF